MKTVLGRTAAVVAMGMMGSAIVQAHITIAPTQSMAGATEKYVLRVPTEGKVATVAAEIDIPDGVVVEVVAMPNGGSTRSSVRREPHHRHRVDDEHPAGRVRRSSRLSRETRATRLKSSGPLRQRFADGTVSDWTKGPERHPFDIDDQAAPRPAQ